jgi:hypothetical protein
MKRRLPISLGLLLSAGIALSSATTFASSNATPASVSGDTMATQAAPPVAPLPASEAPITVTLQSVTADMSYFAGQRVRIPAVRVRDVISPRAVLVEPGNMLSSSMRDDPRVLLVLDTPVTNLTRGTMLEVVARPWIYAEANTRVDRAILDEVEKDFSKFKKNPILTAESVRTVGGLEVSSLR